jgi:uncharacterized protein
VITDPSFYVVAIPAVILLGLGKGGFAGLGSTALPLLALSISPVQGAAILLPLMLVQDAAGMWAFRHAWDGWILKLMLPGAAFGTWAGYMLASRVSTDAVLLALGTISILFALYRLWSERGGRITAPANAPGWTGVLAGAASGFTSQVALQGGPPFQMWVLPRKLPRDVMVGTSAIFFGVINYYKLPAFWALGQFSVENLKTSAVLLPVAILATFAGVRLVRMVEAERFYTIIYLLMIAVGSRLVWKALG